MFNVSTLILFESCAKYTLVTCGCSSLLPIGWCRPLVVVRLCWDLSPAAKGRKSRTRTIAKHKDDSEAQ